MKYILRLEYASVHRFSAIEHCIYHDPLFRKYVYLYANQLCVLFLKQMYMIDCTI